MTLHTDEIKTYVKGLAQKAQKAGRVLAIAPMEQKNRALRASAASLRQNVLRILEANKLDVQHAKNNGKTDSFIDRLKLDVERVEAISVAVEEIANLPDPVGRVLEKKTRPNGLEIERVAVPIGVIGMVFESRPNVAADASALCIKSGNAIILRGGSDSIRSTKIIVACMRAGMLAAGLPEDAVVAVETADRSAVKHLLQCTDHVDLVIPRGGRKLVELVRDEAKVPTLLHLDGNCHTYVHSEADLLKAVDVIRNAKMRRTGICGATESIVLDRAIAAKFVPLLIEALHDCEIRGDMETSDLSPVIAPATPEDWGREYLDAILSVKIVADLNEAIDFISTYSSNHTDAIMTECPTAARAFLQSVDSAVVMHNTSTQFSDGGEFGMGAEIGIATGKIHARGPVGLEQLTSFKYLVRGEGQTRS